MRIGSILIECAAILGMALLLATAVHKFRSDKEQRIAFIGKYQNVYDSDPYGIRKASEPPALPVKPSSQSVSAGVVDSVPKEAVKNGVQAAPEQKTGGPSPKRKLLPGVREIPAEEAIAEYQNGTPFLDARRTRQYHEGHIPRARPMSVWEADVDQRVSAMLEEIALEERLVIYCASGDCADSHMLAEKLAVAGYKDLRIFLGGFPEWVKRGLEVEKGEGEGGAAAGGAVEEGK